MSAAQMTSQYRQPLMLVGGMADGRFANLLWREGRAFIDLPQIISCRISVVGGFNPVVNDDVQLLRRYTH